MMIFLLFRHLNSTQHHHSHPPATPIRHPGLLEAGRLTNELSGNSAAFSLLVLHHRTRPHSWHSGLAVPALSYLKYGGVGPH